MAKEKRTLILASVILSFITAGALLIVGIISKINVDFLYNILSSIDEIVLYTDPDIMANVVLIACIVEATLIGCGNTLLLVAISGKGKYFEQRHTIFITGAVLVILTGVTSIYSILLFIALFMKEKSVGANPQNTLFTTPEPEQETEKEKDMSRLKEEIVELKKMRDEGIITEEEYQKLLTKLI